MKKFWRPLYVKKKEAILISLNWHVYVVVQLLSSLQLCDPLDCSPPGSSLHGILQARVLEWVALSFFRGSSQPRDQTCVSFIGRQILYQWVTWEACGILHSCKIIIIIMLLTDRKISLDMLLSGKENQSA